MNRETELQGALKFTILHAGLLVFCLDATGYFVAQGIVAGPPAVIQLVCLFFMALSWWGIGLLILQRRGPYYRLFGVLLTAVNAVWAVWLLRGGPSDDVLRPGYLIVAAALGGMGLLTTLHSFLMRRPVTSRAGGSAPR